LEIFHHLLNQQIEVYHPKLSYLSTKYKFFIIKAYNKIKESLIKEIPNIINKFTIIENLNEYLSCYNKKYSEKINLHLNIQRKEEDFEIINKITKYQNCFSI
jgi:hypothetical protein